MNPCVTGLTPFDGAVIVVETHDTGDKPCLVTTMPNPTGHIDSIKKTQFSSPWKSGATRTIRVPIALAEATLEYARQLDKGVEPRDTSNSVSVEVDANIALSPDTSDSSNELSKLKDRYEAAKRELEELEGEYEGLVEKYKDLDEQHDEVVEWWKEEEKKVAERDAVIAELRSRIETLQATPSVAPPLEIELPDAFDILNGVKAIPKYKATKIGLVEAILGIIKRLTPDREN